jgi:flagellar hook assembly protein FlgD
MPNPFIFSTLISGKGRISVYDAYGTKVREMAVTGSIRWDGRNTKGQRLPAGVYFLRSETGLEQGKIVILR